MGTDFPAPLSNKAIKLIASSMFPRIFIAQRAWELRSWLLSLKPSTHTPDNHSSRNPPTPITNSHLTFKLIFFFFFLKPSWIRFPDERSWHSVTKIYLILKISEGQLEALKYCLHRHHATCPLDYRYHLEAFSHITVQSVLAQKRLLLY